MLENRPDVDEGKKLNQSALEAARSLARAIGESGVFQRFEAAQDAFRADPVAQEKLRAYEMRREKVKLEAMWGGAGWDDEVAVQREWQEISQLPTLRAFLEAQDELKNLLRLVAGNITNDIGIDFGAACTPAGGCC